ncbi:DeoR/GlpR family DNA-binding transcription regulator [Actinobacillus pleuropneumoniae]|uniref:DeoR/GlpR transcriptional regulator n=1 Tax=Actinobacillus pleuropneumoniae TaxID=715 RepID=A0ABM6X4L3_ACTPL|nr:DeoR/GlpR family DNA-binding transcription regulator [Actinobacillus pleuropneumoniae]AWG96102.1 DeoR/GlpR transcriptional regulator [Actinobacillus pleuropneumoniae serovar 1 str. 4074]AXA22172.1 DeoR/GlpR transcriptional regulator [Actinobacillus pleuropneumoniae]WBY04803.1 DeoR/GlpR family DNA-binding transcription regulator [Actinobacillus pleuropneumoniae]
MESRHSLIIRYLEEFHQASVLELAEQFNVSVETVRRDLNKLSAEGLLHRTHGGAVSNKQRDVGRSFHVRQRIPNIPCKVVSSSMRIIYSLSHKPHIETIATGGVYVEKYNAFYGPLSEQLLSRLKIDIAIISCTGVADGAIWESNEVNIAFKRKLLANSKQVFLLVDHSKLERKDRFKMADLSEVDKLFVNQLPSQTLQNYCAQNSIEIVL